MVVVISDKIASLCGAAFAGIVPYPVLMKINWVHVSISFYFKEPEVSGSDAHTEVILQSCQPD